MSHRLRISSDPGLPGNGLRPRLHADERGRVAFALLAIVLLVGGTVLSFFVLQMDEPGAGMEGERRAIDRGERNIGMAVSFQTSTVIRKGLGRGWGPDRMVREAEGLVEERLEIGLAGAMGDGWSASIEEIVLGLDPGGPDGTGEVKGWVNWSSESPAGVMYSRSTAVSEELDLPLGAVLDAKDRIETAGDEGGDLGSMVRYMLFKLALVRTGRGETDAYQVLGWRDVLLALELALDMVSDMNRTRRGTSPTLDQGGPVNGTVDGEVVEEPPDPADAFLELRDETKVRTSAILSQYLLGLRDYYLRWFRDYSGLGEGVEGFFEWAGEGVTGQEGVGDVSNLTRTRREWWRDFKVGYLVERWGNEILSSIIHIILEMMGDEEIDVVGKDLERLTEELSTSIDEGLGGPSVQEDLERGAPTDVPPELERALEQAPVPDPDRADIVARIQRDVRAMTGAMTRGLLRGAGSLVQRAWNDTVTMDRLHGISTSLPDAGGSGPGEGGVPANGTVEAVSPVDCEGPPETVDGGVILEWSELRAEGYVHARGVHHVAPEDRLSKVLDGLTHPGEGRILSGIRPFETTFTIRVVGHCLIERAGLWWTDPVSGLETGEDLALNLSVPINLSITVPVPSGVPLSGVDYDPSDDLAGDLKELAWEFVNRTWAGLQWAVGSVSEVLSGTLKGLRELGGAGLENLGQMSAATFSRTVEDVLDALYERAWNEAINITWRLARELLGDELREMLTFEIDIMGFDLTVGLDVFEETLTVRHREKDRGFSLTVKRLAEENPPFRPRPVEGFRYSLAAEGWITRGGLSIKASLDPLTVLQPSVLQVTCERRGPGGEGFRLTLNAPMARRHYESWEASISTVSGSSLRGIPVPGTGLRADIDAGVRLKHGNGLEEPDRLIVKSVRRAWYTTLRGYTVKELYGEMGDPELMEAFFVQLLNNIMNSLGDTAREEIPEMEIFIEGGLSTAAGAASGGFSLSFVIKDPLNVLLDLVTWLADNVRAFLLGMAEPGLTSGLVAPPSDLCEQLWIRGFVYTEGGMPDVLGSKEMGRARAGLLVEANLPALSVPFGMDTGRWGFRTGFLLPGLASRVAEVIPGLDAPGRRCDLWFVELSVMELDNDDVVMSEVHYDAEGSDNDEEYIELWNPTDRRVDISGWAVEDLGGRWGLPDHLDIPAGERLVIARDRDGFRRAFGDLPDVSGLTLSLNNDGDGLTLLDPYGLGIDSVAWEGRVKGWECECETGESLKRFAGDDRASSPGAWYCGEPDPGS